MFDRVLTADEVANLHALQRPLVDSGSLDGPHVSADSGTFDRVVIGPVEESQGPLHGREGVGGFLFWEYDGLDGTPQTVIPDGVGDVTRLLGGNAVIAEITGAGTATVRLGVVPGAASVIYNDGTDACTVAVGAGGDVTIYRSAGADTFKVVLWLLWI